MEPSALDIATCLPPAALTVSRKRCAIGSLVLHASTERGKESMRRTSKELVRKITRASILEHESSFEYVEAKQAALSQYITSIRASMREVTPRNPALHGFKVYSQGDEDGIIEYLLGELPEGTGNRTFIEIGCGNGLENNSHYLLLKGYRGVWIDGSESNVQLIRDGIDEPTIDQGRLIVSARFVDRENLPAVLAESCSFIGNKEPDFFLLDIDGNDGFLAAEAISHIQPKIICVEYNSTFPPNFATSIKYNKSHIWKEDDYHGASLLYLCNVLIGYSLAACSILGVNAFFVRNDLAHRYPSYPIEKLYQPFRSEIRWLRPGHPASLKWLRTALHSGLRPVST